MRQPVGNPGDVCDLPFPLSDRRLANSEWADAIEQTCENVRAHVAQWGLTETGVTRILEAVARIETNTAADLAAAEAAGIDITETLGTRLSNLRALRHNSRAMITAARNLDWLPDWMQQAEGEAEERHLMVPALCPAPKATA